MGGLRLVSWFFILLGGVAILGGINLLTSPGWTFIAGGMWLTIMGLLITNALTPKREDDS